MPQPALPAVIHRPHWALAPLLLLLASGCQVNRIDSVPPNSEVLGERTLEDGTQVRWRLRNLGDGSPSLEVLTKRPQVVAFLGLSVKELNREQAKALSQTPWSGLLVTAVTDKSAAQKAGIWAGDILVSVNDRPVVSTLEFTDRIRLELLPGQPTSITVRRGEEERRLELIPEERRVEDSEVKTIALQGSNAVRKLTGMTVGLFDEELSQEVFETPGPQLVIAGVVPGSPAYMAGLRRGDRIVSLDGQSPVPLDSLVVSTLGRALQKGYFVNTDERPAELPARSQKGPIDLEVSGPLGPHRAQLEVNDDLEHRSHIDIPILYECDDSISGGSWSFLNFIFQFGGNGSYSFQESSSRQPARFSSLSLLPLGLFECESRPGWSHYRLLWFIEWSSRS